MTGDLSKHFSSREFACECNCGFDEISYLTIDVLERIRVHFKTKVIINSGCRCTKHNKKVGGVPNSQHVKGTAADIVVEDVSPRVVADYVDSEYPNGFGLGRYRTFTHIDTRNRKARWGKN